MSSRNSTIEAFQDHLSIAADIDQRHAQWKSTRQERIFRTNRKIAFYMLTSIALAVVAYLTMKNSTDVLNYAFSTVGLVLVFLAVRNLFHLDTINDYGFKLDQERKESYRKFADVLSAELKSIGVNVLSIHDEERYIATDRGNVTVVTNENSDIPQVLLNGEMLKHDYLMNTRKAVDTHRREILVPDSVVAQ